MALSLKINIAQDLDTGLIIRIDDITGNYTSDNTGGYGSPNPAISDVHRTRFLFSSYLTETQADQNVTECITSVEYEVWGSGSGVVTVDAKEFVLGNKFILEVDATPDIDAGLKLRETGRYALMTDFLPADGHIDVIPSEMGIDSTTLVDGAYQVTYEEYNTEYADGETFGAGTYIVIGDPESVIEVASSGFQYNPGEVFTVSGATTFSDVTGTNSIAKFNAEVVANFPLFYDAWTLYNSIQQEYASTVVNNKPCLAQKIFQMNTLFKAIQINYEDTLNNDDSGTQSILEEIVNIGNQQCV